MSYLNPAMHYKELDDPDTSFDCKYCEATGSMGEELGTDFEGNITLKILTCDHCQGTGQVEFDIPESMERGN